MDSRKIQEIYNKFALKSPKELDEIIGKIDENEKYYLEKEHELKQLEDEENEITELVSEIQQQKHSKKREEMILENNFALANLIDLKTSIQKELNTEKKERNNLLNAKYVIENYIFQDNPLPAQKVLIIDPTIHKSTLIDHPLHEVKTEIKKDEMKLFLTTIYNLYVDNATDDELYRGLDQFSTSGLQNIIKTNTKAITDYERYLHDKLSMDTRVGKKPKQYQLLLNIIKKYKDQYNFVKRTQPIIEKVLKLRQKTDIGTTADLSKINSDKLKELIKKCPELKEGISNVLLSELIKKGTVVKKRY